MRRNTLLLSLLSTLLFFCACQKEYSFELGGTGSSGSLQSDVAGECLPKTVQGIYEAGTVLNGATNYIDIQVNVESAGNYRIYSDTVNGIFFQAKGAFATTGINNVRLTGNGTPINAGLQSFVITYDSTECSVAVTTLPQGGGGPAEFTLSGAPATCLDFNLSGNYIVGQALNPTNTVVIKVDVTKIGTYNVNTGTESNGMIFSGTGALTALGAQTITLIGTGTPAVAAATNMTVSGATGCGFTVNATQGAVFTPDCATAVVNGVYEAGTQLDATNTVNLTVNVTTPGPYSITATENGMTFTGSGDFAAAGAGQTITLAGSGTPTADGDINVQIPGECAFIVTVDPGAAPTDLKWKFTSGGVTYEGTTDGAITLPLAGLESTGISGESTDGNLSFALTLTKNAPMQTGSFSSAAIPPANLATLMVMNNTTSELPFSAVGPGTTLTVVLTTYNETTKVAEGTFSGTVKNAANADVTITNGTFKAEIL